MTSTVLVGSAVSPSGVFCWHEFGQPHVARAAQVKGPHPLRNDRLNPSSQSILLLEGFSPLKLACCLERGMLRLWSDDHRSAWIFAGGLNTIGKTRARLAVSGGKLDLDQFRMRLAANPAPTGTRFPLWTGCEPLLPIQDKLTRVNAIRGMGLPLGIKRHRTYDLNAKARLALCN